MTVEILVPQDSMSRVKQALGPLPSARFHSRPSARSTSRLVVTSLDSLNTASGRASLEELLRQVPKEERFVVLFAIGVAAIAVAALQAFGRLSQQTRDVPYVAPNLDAIHRLILARRNHAEKALIASAAIEDDKLVVWSCEPIRYAVPLAELHALAGLDADALRRFEVSTSGSRIRWPEADIDLNLDTVREHADPAVKAANEAKARQEASRYASAIRGLRRERGIKQAGISGICEREVRRIESGETVPHIESLRKLAAAHEMTLNEYMAVLAKRHSSRRDQQA